MTSIGRFFLFLVFGLFGRLGFGQSDDGSTADQCEIPEGQFIGMIEDINSNEPYYGSRCVVRNAMVQVRKWVCMPYYCCDQPCTCGSSTLLTKFQTCKNNSLPQMLSCFVINVEKEGHLYGCCPGSEEDGLRVCSTAIDCKVNNGGCDQLCQRNATSGRDYCNCYPGYQRRLLNSNGTAKCIGNGPIPSSDATSTITTTVTTVVSTPTDGAVSSGGTGFPIPYIIAIAVALFLLLLVLLLLLLLLCCRKRKAAEKKTVFVISSLEKKTQIEDYEDIESGKKKLDDDDKEKMSNTDRQENEYTEDPVTGNGRGTIEDGKGQGQLTDEGLKGYESLTFDNKMELDDGTYEELDGYVNEDEHHARQVD